MYQKVIFSFLFLCRILSAENLKLNESSEHFEIFYSQSDKEIAQEFLTVAESFYPQLMQDFDYAFENKLKINIFPNILSFQETYSLRDVFQAIVARCGTKFISIVSPLNPGSYHSADSIRTIFHIDLIQSVIMQKYDYSDSKNWLVFGVAANKAGYQPRSPLPDVLPTIQELETSFGNSGGHPSAHSFVHFLIGNYGWEKILQLLENYSFFEEILEKSKETIYHEWSQTSHTISLNSDLQHELIEMCEKEQLLRSEWINANKIGSTDAEEWGKRVLEIDHLHLIRLQEIVKNYACWPGYSLIGSEGSHAFWLLVQHTPDENFQSECLDLLEKAVQEQDASPIDLAYLKDRVYMYAGKKQIYGTQLQFNDSGDLIFYPIEDEEHVNERRLLLGLPSLWKNIFTKSEKFTKKINEKQ